MISIDGQKVGADVKLLYTQDPDCPSNSIIAFFDYLPFFKLSWDMVDTSGGGFVHVHEYSMVTSNVFVTILLDVLSSQ